MEIKKILNIESPVHLYRILDRNNEIVDSAEGDLFFTITYFMDCAYEYLYGCRCDEESNHDRMVAEYETSMREESVISHIRSSVGCDDIVFN
jgi:hypothetical protein